MSKKRTAENKNFKNKKTGVWHGFQYALTLCLAFFSPFFSIPLQAASDTQNMPLTFYIEPVRVVHAEASSGGPSVNLGSVMPGVEVPSQTVQVSIITNTESPYSVYHELRNEITNQSGALLPEESFRYRVENGQRGSESLVPSWAPVPDSRSLIARGRGGADTFTIDYRVQGKTVLEAGDYYGNAKITVEDA